MKCRSIYKIPKGKLLKIFIDYDKKNNLITEINITGDFFAYPEESIEILENQLKNVSLKRNTLFKKIESVININKIEFIGLNIEGLVEGILRCLN
jgi:hypothetical protein